MSKEKKEKRFLASEIERRMDEEGEDSNVLEGYASVFGTVADIGGFFDETVARGAFTRAVQEGQDVRALVDHDASKVLGRTKSKTLELVEDDKGLRVKITLPDTTVGRDIKESVRRGDVSQMSIGFFVVGEEVDRTGDKVLRTITDVDLFDVSVVTYPAFEDTEISLRSAIDAFNQSESELSKEGKFKRIYRAKLNLLELSVR